MQSPVLWPDSAVSTLTIDEAYQVLEYDLTHVSVDLEVMRTEISRDIDIHRVKLNHVLHSRSQQIILGNNTSKVLSDTLETFLTPNGIRISAASDMGWGRSHNEDRVAVHTASNAAMVIDGIGGQYGGEETAQLLAESFLRNPTDIQKIVDETLVNMKAADLQQAGACFMYALVELNDKGVPVLQAAQAGDVGLSILNPDHTVAFQSQDEGQVEEWARRGIITLDESHYHDNRNVVLNGISLNKRCFIGITRTCTNFPLESGQKILLMSDGVGGNLLPEEYALLTKDLTGPNSIQVFSDTIKQRWIDYTPIDAAWGSAARRAKGVFPDGFKTRPHLDNRAIAILELPQFLTSPKAGVA